MQRQQQSSDVLILAVEIWQRHLQDMRQQFHGIERRLMHAKLIAADSVAGAGLVQTNRDTHYLLSQRQSFPSFTHTAADDGSITGWLA